jgi:ankyrin repeat protein
MSNDIVALLKGGAISSLLKNDPNFPHSDLKGNSPLIWCADAGQVTVRSDSKCDDSTLKIFLDFQVDAVKSLLECKSEINRKGISGNTALMRAARNGHYSCAELLLKHGADPALRNSKEQVTNSIQLFMRQKFLSY